MNSRPLRHLLRPLTAAALLLGMVAPVRAATPEQTALWRQQARGYEHGEGVPRDVATAIDLYCKAAQAGDAESRYNLGWIYANGRGVERNDGFASHWFARAALMGDPHAEAMHKRLATPADKPGCVQEAERLAARSAEQRRLEDEKTEQATRYRVHVDTPEERRIMKIVYKLAPQFGIQPGLAFAVIRAESNFNVNALSDKNAQGLMQLIPETAARFAVRKPFDAEQNIRGGLAYLQWLLAYFKGNVPLVLAAYNAGEGTVDRYRGVPPFPETQGYIKRIQQVFALQQHPFDARITAPSPALPGILSAARP